MFMTQNQNNVNNKHKSQSTETQKMTDTELENDMLIEYNQNMMWLNDVLVILVQSVA